MTYLTVHYQDRSTLEVAEKIYTYRFKWVAIIHTLWLDTYGYEYDPNTHTRVEYTLKYDKC
jgi:hypothetical protein